MLRSGPSPTRLYRLRLAIPIALALVVVAATAGAAATWTRVASPNRGTVASVLQDVTTVPGSTTAWAVGYSYDSNVAAYRTLVERSNGTSWSIVASPSGSASGYSQLNRVDATAANNVWARRLRHAVRQPGRALQRHHLVEAHRHLERLAAGHGRGRDRRGVVRRLHRLGRRRRPLRQGAVEHAVHALRHGPAPAGARGGHRGPGRRRLGGRLGPELRRPRPAGLQPGRARTRRHMGTSGLAEPVQPQHPQRRGRAGQRRHRRGRGRPDGDRRRHHPALAHAALARQQLVGR